MHLFVLYGNLCLVYFTIWIILFFRFVFQTKARNDVVLIVAVRRSIAIHIANQHAQTTRQCILFFIKNWDADYLLANLPKYDKYSLFFIREFVRNQRENHSWIREIDFVREFVEIEKKIVNSWICDLGNRKLTKVMKQSWNHETCHRSWIRENSKYRYLWKFKISSWIEPLMHIEGRHLRDIRHWGRNEKIGSIQALVEVN